MSKYRIVVSSTFKKDIKLIKKRGYDILLLDKVVSQLANDEPLDKQYHDHALTGNFSHCRECHIKPNWLLIYEIYNEELILYLTRTGSHSDLF